MKRILTGVLLLVGVGCFGQISEPVKSQSLSVGKIGTLAEITYTVDRDTTYFLAYRNQEYQTLNSYEVISFSGEDNTLDKFYTAIKSVYLEENRKNKDYSLSFKLGKESILILPMKPKNAYVSVSGKGYFAFGEKQIDKLFGK